MGTITAAKILPCPFCGSEPEVMAWLVQVVERRVAHASPPGTCPRCGSAKLYYIARYSRIRCAASECRHEWRPEAQTARGRYAKKPQSWYDKITELHRQGINPYQIGKRMGAKDTKSIAAFIKRLQAFDQIAKAST
jgi:hypothetical protein